MEMLTTNNEIALVEKVNGLPAITADAGRMMADIIRNKKVLEKAEKELKARILEEMEKNGIIKAETEFASFTYKASYDRESFDAKAFREKHADLYDEFAVLTPVKASVLVKVK